jgi:hypothetical protein
MVIPAQGAPANCISDLQVTKYITLYLHPTSTITSGMTGSQYYMNITANTITNQFPPLSSCSNCNVSLNSFVNTINTTSTSNDISYRTNRTFDAPGIYYITPFSSLLYQSATTASITALTQSSSWVTSTNVIDTYPFSGVPSTIIPSLSGTVCNYNLTGSQSVLSQGRRTNTHRKWYFEVRQTNPLDPRDFEIWAAPIINYIADTNNLVLAYKSVAGNMTFSNPTYIS